MTETYNVRPTLGRALIGALLGALVGLFSPYALAMGMTGLMSPGSAMFSALAIAPAVLTARLFAYGGIWAATVSSAAQLAAANLYFGAAGTALVFVALVLPLMITLIYVPRGLPLAQMLRMAIPLWMLCALGAFLLAHMMAGMSVAEYVAAAANAQIGAVPPGMVDILAASLTNATLPADLSLQAFGADFLTKGFLTAAERAQMVPAALSALRNSVVVMLPGVLIASAALSGLLSVAWPSRALARRDQLPARSYPLLWTWHLPAGMTYGLVGLYFAGLILVTSVPKGAMEAAYVAVTWIAGLGFRVQAAGSVERRLTQRGMRPGARGALIAAFVLLPIFSSASFYYGMFSALFGPTHGAIAPLLKRGDGDGEDS